MFDQWPENTASLLARLVEREKKKGHSISVSKGQQEGAQPVSVFPALLSEEMCNSFSVMPGASDVAEDPSGELCHCTQPVCLLQDSPHAAAKVNTNYWSSKLLKLFKQFGYWCCNIYSSVYMICAMLYMQFS